METRGMNEKCFEKSWHVLIGGRKRKRKWKEEMQLKTVKRECTLEELKLRKLIKKTVKGENKHEELKFNKLVKNKCNFI